MSGAVVRPLSVVEYDLAERDAFVAEDREWRQRNPHVTGGPLRTLQGKMAPVPVFIRLDLQTDRNGPVSEFAPALGPCWLWRGVPVNGYGYIRCDGRKVQAYRINYERWVGPIPPGLPMDHLCRVRRCVNPLHVEPVTYSENARRSPIHPGNVRAARTDCPAGHPFDTANTYITPEGWRRCRKCQAIQDSLVQGPADSVTTRH